MMADVWTRRHESKLSRFLDAFPNKHESTPLESLPYRRIFWSQRPECDPLSSSSDDGDVRVIHDKIKSAFSDVHVPRMKGLLQFWAPVKSTTGGRRLLSTSDQPFALEYLDRLFQKYRLCCIKYRYSIDDQVNDNNKKLADEDNPLIISKGPVATAFLNQFPELVVDLRLYRGSPLVDEAMECGLTCLILLPVFYQQTSSSTSSCVGVVECCMKISGLLAIFNDLKRALERVGLSTYHVQECLPYEAMPGLKYARGAIEEALKIVCDSYQLSLAQVWITKEIGEHTFVVKLCGYHVDDLKDGDDIKAYSDSCDVLPLKRKDGVPGWMLEQTNCPIRFYKDVSTLRQSLKGWYSFIFGAINGCSCFVIGLRSIHTGDMNYAFEFLWPKSRNNAILSKCLLPTLGTCLPSFKYVSDVSDAYDETLQMPYPLEEEWQRPRFVRRRLSGCEDAQNDNSDNADSEFWGYSDDIPVAANYYTGTMARFELRCSYMLENLKEEVEDRFRLEPETYILKFQSFEEVEVELDTDDDLARCIKLWRTGRCGWLADFPFIVLVLQKE